MRFFNKIKDREHITILLFDFLYNISKRQPTVSNLEISNFLKMKNIKEEILPHYISTFVVNGYLFNHSAINPYNPSYIVGPNLVIDYLDYLEYQTASKSSRLAMWVASISILIAIITGFLQIATSYTYTKNNIGKFFKEYIVDLYSVFL
jgi:hypothetical protein